MKYLLAILLLTGIYSLPAFSQNDTTFLYFDKSWKECNKDTACYYDIVYKTRDLWSRKDFRIKGNQLQLTGTYLDKECRTAHGVIKWYYENGTTKITANYVDGKKVNYNSFYPSGKKKGHIDYLANGTKQKGWAENGKELAGYIVEKQAEFPGGITGWKAYLEKNLNAAVAAGSNTGTYKVKVQFIVDKEGNVSNVQAVEVPDGCKVCGEEATRIIKMGPKWQPAIQDNQPVLYEATQYISFNVDES